MSIFVKAKFIDQEMTTDIELENETSARIAADEALQTSLNTHASRHLPNGADPLTTGIPVPTANANAIGEANSFARADHVHKTEVTSYSQRSITGTTALVTDSALFTITNPLQGTYQVVASLISICSQNNGVVTPSLYVDGTQVSGTEVSLQRAGNATTYLPYIVSTNIEVNGSQSIELRWRSGATNNTVSNIIASISLVKVS
jgi:hypothetical protein